MENPSVTGNNKSQVQYLNPDTLNKIPGLLECRYR